MELWCFFLGLLFMVFCECRVDKLRQIWEDLYYIDFDIDVKGDNDFIDVCEIGCVIVKIGDVK